VNREAAGTPVLFSVGRATAWMAPPMSLFQQPASIHVPGLAGVVPVMPDIHGFRRRGGGVGGRFRAAGEFRAPCLAAARVRIGREVSRDDRISDMI
jgi:hypothetical protein